MRNNENAANRYSYVGENYNIGEKAKKVGVLKDLKEEWGRLHEEGYIHIHDLDAYGMTYNCLTFDICRDFPFEQYIELASEEKICGVFGYLTRLFEDMGNEQSGGMALANFDCDMAYILSRLGIKMTKANKNIIAAAIRELILWCNNTHTRMGQTSYYVTLNIGLADNSFARFIAKTLIEVFEKAGDTVFKPNIVFKVKAGVNEYESDKNFDLFQKALLCSARKMIPTYLLCDCKEDKDVLPKNISVMGCRTRVVDDLFGERSSIGRGNIDNISINLPRLALEVATQCKRLEASEKIEKFTARWDELAVQVKDILLDRFEKVCSQTADKFPINAQHHLWIEDFGKNLKDVFRHGTLSIGFIGLSEAIEILTGKKFFYNMESCICALGFVKHMRDYCDFLRNQYGLNFSLLATSGELISGRFVKIDRKKYHDGFAVFKKGFYTNSFHVEVDSGMPAFDKIEIEGLFHEYCNGGSITYVELREAPIGNDEGLREYIEHAVKSGVHYLGFNFPKDVCEKCQATGVFDRCPECGSVTVKHIRRVSGYLEILDGFTEGKKNEEKKRRTN